MVYNESAISLKKLIIDAAILFSFFKKDSTRRQIFEWLLDNGCELISPFFVLEELRNEKNRIMRFSKISHGEFEFTLSVLEDEVGLIPEEKYKQFLPEAEKVSPHKKDIPYFALALSNNFPIWSDEKAFKTQHKVKVFSTEDLLKEVV